MSDFTKGPWRAFTQESFSGWWSVEDSEGNELGSCDGGFYEADARLIAAAPDLLEAIKAMIDEFRALDLPYGSEAYTKAVSAYNKATEG